MSSFKHVAALAALAVGTLAVACGGTSASPSPLCGTGSECQDTPQRSANPPAQQGDAIGTPTKAPEDTAPTTQPEGGDAPSGAAGPLCTALATCCAEIKSSGADSSVCEGAVAKRDETACSKANDGYASFGPCAPAPTPECTKLAACCVEIMTSGADSSVCEAAVAKKNEAACSSAYDGYKTYGPCT